MPCSDENLLKSNTPLSICKNTGVSQEKKMMMHISLPIVVKVLYNMAGGKELKHIYKLLPISLPHYFLVTKLASLTTECNDGNESFLQLSVFFFSLFAFLFLMNSVIEQPK
jgi:ABC-type polysaccharide transport system permease subunit